jgi:CBS domain-containing protein
MSGEPATRDGASSPLAGCLIKKSDCLKAEGGLYDDGRCAGRRLSHAGRNRWDEWFAFSALTSGAPIVNDAGNFVGFVSEFDLLGAIESGKDLSQITADKLMNKDHFVADESTTIADAIELMREKHLLNIPVVKQGQVAYSVTRHDLLRARIGLGPGIET